MRNWDYYFITDSDLTKKSVLEDVKSALSAGCKVVQYREKNLPTREMVGECRKIKKLCAGKADFIINDRLDVCIAVDADGIHLGQDDLEFAVARKYLPDKIIGITVHNLREAVEAEEQGADYLGFSPVFETSTKKDAGTPSGPKELKRVLESVSILVVAIGGINMDNLLKVLETGCKSICMMSAVLTTDNVEKESKKIIGVINDATGKSKK